MTSRLACSMFLGIFRKPFSRKESVRFQKAIADDYDLFPGRAAIILEANNSLLFCSPCSRQNREFDPTKSGGYPLLFLDGFTGNQKSAKSFGLKAIEIGRVVKDALPTFKHLNGSWAAAYVDDVREKITLGRDIAGAQSVYYALRNNIFYFTSSLTCFRKLGFPISQDAVCDFLHYLYVPAPATIYAMVQSVQPGQTVAFDGEKLQFDNLPRKNFQTKNNPAPIEISESKLLSSFEEHLKHSIQRSCAGAKRIGLFLSGGKDSSSIAVAVKECGLNNVHAITIGFDEKNIDETKDAKVVAYHLGLPFRQLRFSRETYLKYWPDLIRRIGQPFGDSAALAVFAGLKESVDEYDSFLDGMGNDRYLGHATNWQEDLAWYIHRRIPGLHHLPWKFVPWGYSYSVDVVSHFLSKPREEQFVSWNGWTTKEISKLTGREPNWRNSRLYSLYRNCSSPIIHKTLTLWDVWGPETAYRKMVQVANTMGRSVRYPFLDRDIVNFSQNLPSSYKYKGRVDKIIMRLLQNKFLPEQIVNKKKGGFIFPKEYILGSDNYRFLNVFLSSDCIRKYGWVDDSMVNTYVQRYKNGDKYIEDRIWALVLLHAWAELTKD